MAGDWIPFSKDLPRKPEVLRIAADTGRSCREVACILLEFWAWVDGQSADGKVSVVVPQLSRIVWDTNLDLWQAVVRVGWIVETDGGIVIPNWDYWMGRSAKQRLQACRRKRDKRSGRYVPVPQVSHKQRDTCGTTEQYSTNTLTPLPPSLDTPEFCKAWADWLAYRKQRKQALTPIGIGRQLKHLAAWGAAKAIEAIERSITNGWQGLFEPADGPGGGVGRLGRLESPPGKYANVGEKVSAALAPDAGAAHPPRGSPRPGPDPAGPPREDSAVRDG